MINPNELEWQYGEMPSVEAVPYDCCAILFSESYIGTVYPNGGYSNPLRWGDNSGFPNWGLKSPIGWWAWIRKGTDAPRPAFVKTWTEMYGQ